MKHLTLISTIACGILFFFAAMWTVAAGTMSGLERDDNIYQSPSQTLFPWFIAASAVFAVGTIAGVIRLAQRHHQVAKYHVAR